MDNQFNKAKGFGEILDQTFRLSKSNFSVFFLIFLILQGPFILLEALVQLAYGTSLFQAGETGAPWYERMISGLGIDEIGVEDDLTVLARDAWVSFIAIISYILYPIAQAAIIIGVLQIKNQRTFTTGILLKGAFSRFGPVIGSSIIYYLIGVAIFVVPFFLLLVFGVISIAVADNVITILLFILSIIALVVFVFYFLLRWYLYLPFVVVEKDFPGIGKSWNITKGHGWRIFGLFAVIFIIMLMVATAVEFTLSFFFGYSVFTTVIASVVALFVNMVTAVALAVIFFDLKVRNHGEDLQMMMDDYKS
ncbi:hypothetical protein [Alkalihalobacillus pseudalcaliphilus]|uniref:hypothetical protein n=1 Tax=Alkalihalobacillus pseudalcaliphilus TaxID=79884 RepID=UPI00064DE25F|nr:hypothetical protein [Alkalihalobacillus pseudalcaliphilus]KMK75070.1 hypothetical protein AB990_16545 [Alkalihalobacillus pseudalcaliphilus]